jgi:hypothetical protein
MFMASATVAGETVTLVIWPKLIATAAVVDPPAFVASKFSVAVHSAPEPGAAAV